jgi:hypothetical protein
LLQRRRGTLTITCVCYMIDIKEKKTFLGATRWTTLLIALIPSRFVDTVD